MNLLFRFDSGDTPIYQWTRLAKLIDIDKAKRLISWGDGWASNGNWLLRVPTHGLFSLSFSKENGKADREAPYKKERDSILKMKKGYRVVTERTFGGRPIVLAADSSRGWPDAVVLDHEDGTTAVVVDARYLHAILDIYEDEKLKIMATAHDAPILFVSDNDVIGALMPIRIDDPREYDPDTKKTH
jgi:hypothetical protein